MGGGPLHTPLIAIVDDDMPFLELMDDLLRDAGFRTIGCATTSDALATVARARPDLVILDLWMETRDAGWQLLDRLRRDPGTAAVPVLICSADHEGLSEHAERLSADGYTALAKPFDLEDLLAAVSTLLATRCAHAAP
jgi:CheY-like chemotaxis protein